MYLSTFYVKKYALFVYSCSTNFPVSVKQGFTQHRPSNVYANQICGANHQDDVMSHPSSLCTVLIIVYSTLNMLDNVYTDAGRAPIFFTKYQTLGVKS